MGNTLNVGATGVTVNVSDINNKLAPVSQLGGRKQRGRLFTGIHCRRTEGTKEDVVVKVFLRTYDDRAQTNMLKKHYQDLMDLEKKMREIYQQQRNAAKAEAKGISTHTGVGLISIPPTVVPCNYLHYSTVKLTERAAHFERPFVAYNLLERLHIRPLLSECRCMFLAFQLILGLHQLHTVYDVCHGDLKAENCLINSMGWLYIVDIAPFKPASIEAYNSANFELYYDSTEQRTCTLAPERFYDEHEAATAHEKATKVVPEMDIFSAACVIAQMVTEQPLFKLSDCLELRSKASKVEQAQFLESRLASCNTPKHVRELIHFMTLGSRFLGSINQGRAVGEQVRVSTPPAEPHSAVGFAVNASIGEEVAKETANSKSNSSEATDAANEGGEKSAVNGPNDDHKQDELASTLQFEDKNENELPPPPSTAERAETAENQSQATSKPDGEAEQQVKDDAASAQPAAPARPEKDENDDFVVVEDAPAVVVATPAPIRPSPPKIIEEFTPTLFRRYFPFLYYNVLPSLLSKPPDLQLQFLWGRLFDIVEAAALCEADPEFAKGMAMPGNDFGLLLRKCEAAAAAEGPQNKFLKNLVKNRVPQHPLELLKKENETTATEQQQCADDASVGPVRTECIEILAPVLVSALRHAQLEDSLCKGLYLLLQASPLCSEATRYDTLIPAAAHVARSTRPIVTPLVRATALKVLASVAEQIRVFPASEAFIMEEYVLPAIQVAMKLGYKSTMVMCAVAQALPKTMTAALYMLEQREGLGKGYQSHLSFDAQRYAVINRTWDNLKPLFSHPNSSVLTTVLDSVPILIPVLGVELVADQLLPLLTTMLGSTNVEVRRLMIRRAVDIAQYIYHAVVNSAGTIIVIFEDALRDKDAKVVHTALIGIRDLLTHGVLPTDSALGLVYISVGLMAHPNKWVASAAAQLISSAARTLHQVDVLVKLEGAVRSLLVQPIPLVEVAKMREKVIRPEAQLAIQDMRRRIPCCADYHRLFPVPREISVGPYVQRRQAQSLRRSPFVDLSDAECAWALEVMKFEQQLGYEQSYNVSSNPSQKHAMPWHMSVFCPTPRQQKRMEHQIQASRFAISRTGWSKVATKMNLKKAASNIQASVSTATASDDLAATKSQKSFANIATQFVMGDGDPAFTVPTGKGEANPTGAVLCQDPHAHDGAIHASSASHRWLITGGTDGIVKLWDVGGALSGNTSSPDGSTPILHGQSFKNIFTDGTAADDHVSKPSPILFAEFISTSTQHLLAAVGNSAGQLAFLDVGAEKTSQRVTLDNGNAGGLSASCNVENSNFAVFGSHRGGIYVIDTRTPGRKEVWSAKIPAAKGPVCGLVSACRESPFAVVAATLRGYVGLFDLRFQALISSTTVCSGYGGGTGNTTVFGISRIASGQSTTGPSIAVATSTHDIIRLSLYDFEEGLSMRPAAPNSARAIHATNGGTLLLTGGTDRKLRVWDPLTPEKSRTITTAAEGSPPYQWNKAAQAILETPPDQVPVPKQVMPSFTINSLGLPIHRDVMNPLARGPQPETDFSHVDTITSIKTVCGPGSQRYIASMSRDGAVKVWRNQ